jgi:hypothetical protein
MPAHGGFHDHIEADPCNEQVFGQRNHGNSHSLLPAGLDSRDVGLPAGIHAGQLRPAFEERIGEGHPATGMRRTGALAEQHAHAVPEKSMGDRGAHVTAADHQYFALIHEGVRIAVGGMLRCGRHPIPARVRMIFSRNPDALISGPQSRGNHE